MTQLRYHHLIWLLRVLSQLLSSPSPANMGLMDTISDLAAKIAPKKTPKPLGGGIGPGGHAMVHPGDDVSFLFCFYVTSLFTFKHPT